MSTKRPSDADNDSPDHKRPKMEEEEEFPFIKRIAILQSYGTTICQVPADELQKILKVGARVPNRYYLCTEVSIAVHNFELEESLVKFLGHWVYFRDPAKALDATFNREIATVPGDLDEERLAFLIKAINAFDDPVTFTCDIADSLIDEFLGFLRCGGHRHIDQIYKICKDSCKTRLLAKVFASHPIHEKQTFAQQVPACDYDRAVQSHMYAWLAEVLINGRDWSKLPPRLRGGRLVISDCLFTDMAKTRTVMRSEESSTFPPDDYRPLSTSGYRSMKADAGLHQ